MYSFDLNEPLQLRVNEIHKNEFVYLKLPSDSISSEEDNHSVFSMVSKETDRLFFSIDQLGKYPAIKKYEADYPIAWFGVPVAVGSNQQREKNEQTIYSNSDPQSFTIYDSLCTQFSDQHKVIPEFELIGNHYQMGPTIVEFFDRYKLPFAFIKIEGAPNSEKIQQFRETFESLRIKGFKGTVYFSFNNPHLDEWNLKTYNTFSGLRTVHVDLSNKCTHSCVFCSLWGPDFIDDMKKNSVTGALPINTANFMNRQMTYEGAIKILESVPDTVQTVQFGGAGDPLTHPQWLEIITRWRTRGFKVEVLTNFEYPSFEEIEILHKLAKGRRTFEFLINVSAATPEVYKTIRPRQSTATFEKVIANIRYARELKLRDNFGMRITIINIINTHNFKEAVKMVELAHELGTGVYLKPLEVHAELHKKFTISKEDYPLFKQTMKDALKRADELKVRFFLRELIEAIVGADLNE